MMLAISRKLAPGFSFNTEANRTREKSGFDVETDHAVNVPVTKGQKSQGNTVVELQPCGLISLEKNMKDVVGRLTACWSTTSNKLHCAGCKKPWKFGYFVNRLLKSEIATRIQLTDCSPLSLGLSRLATDGLGVDCCCGLDAPGISNCTG